MIYDLPDGKSRQNLWNPLNLFLEVEKSNPNDINLLEIITEKQHVFICNVFTLFQLLPLSQL